MAARTAISEPRLAAREQQVRDVGTGNQQHQRHRRQEHEQGPACVADHVLVERDDRGQLATIRQRMLRFELPRDRRRQEARR
jgi:hypothetical protein